MNVFSNYWTPVPQIFQREREVFPDDYIFHLFRCPKVNFVHLLPSPVNETRFSLSAFEFTSSQSNVVYIHCQASVCLATSQCTPDCTPSSRSKRDLNSEPSHLLSMGPLLFVSDKGKYMYLINDKVGTIFTFKYLYISSKG